MSALLANLELVFGWLLAASWQAAVLALAVMAIQALFGARLNPRWRYALWLLIVLRLVLPALPESALSLFQFAPPPPVALTASVTEPLFVSAPILPPPDIPVALPMPSRPFSIYSLLASIWLAGAIALSALTIIVNQRFVRQVANSPEITDPELLRLFSKAKEEFGVRRPIRLIENAHVQSPAIMGLFHPTLLLPVGVGEKFDARELRFIFLHELAHLKRGDVLIQALIALLQILHWFNPVLWFAFRRMRIDREPATDALVLSRTGESEKERYGLMLIKLLEHFNQRHSLATLVGILEDKDQFKHRFSLIARFTRGAYGWSLLGVLLIGILGLACLTKSKAAQPPTIGVSSQAEASFQDPSATLIAAVRKDDVTAVQKAIDAGADPGRAVSDGQSILFAARSAAVAELLLKHGADAKARNNQGDLVLNYLCRNGGRHPAVLVGVLLEHGADPNGKAGELGDTPLMGARDAATVDLLVEHGANIHATLSDGTTMLEMASSQGVDYFQALLRHGVAFDAKTDGPTLLLHAAWVNNLSLMKEMLDRGVDPNVEGVWAKNKVKPDMMMKPLEATVVDNQFEAVKLLLDHGAKADDQMINGLGNRRKKIIAVFWAHGVRNISPLAYAVSQGAPTGDVQKLLDGGSPVDPPEDKRMSPLTIAAQLGEMEVVQLLVARGADVNKGPPYDPKFPIYHMSPLVMAASEGQDEIVSYLLAHGADPYPGALWDAAENSTPYDDQRPKEHFEKCVRILLDAGALKTATPELQGYILFSGLVTRQGPANSKVVKMLLDAGMSPEVPMPYLAENGEKPDSVIGYYRDWYAKKKDDPTYGSMAATMKPMLDMLEAADKGVPPPIAPAIK